ncbi:HNH endonuclease [Priestia megaterium]|uniref:HNH endonuclease n=1 Tax=Priestia megaterium TaxID=1404 RepID=UPI0023DC75CA|nr:HNH endonuclease [Priestia megaterium]MDF2015554.1 HNH endonuclease [Priestia megaterium]
MEVVVFCEYCHLVIRGDKCSCNGTGTAYKKGEQTRHPSTIRKFQKLRKSIIIRDEYHCQRCMTVYGQLVMEDLECHHIKSFRDYPELAYDKTNLITVCRRCNLDLGNSNKLDFNWIAPELKVPTL